jgi:hypothetical protein
MDLAEKVRKANHQGQCGTSEEYAHEPLQLHSQQDFQEERRDHGAHKQSREGASRNCCACQVAPLFKALKLDLDRLSTLQFGWERLFGKSAASVDDAGEAPCHYVQDTRNPGQQEDRSQCQLDGVTHITDVHGRVEHEAPC